MTVESAIDCFCAGFCAGRSFTHPFNWTRAGNIWHMKDAPGKKRNGRLEEFVTFQTPAEQALAHIRACRPSRFGIGVMSDLTEDLEEVKRTHKACGLRLLVTEPLFVLDVRHAAHAEGQLPVRRVRTKEEAEALKKAARRHQVLPRHLTEADPEIRAFIAADGEEVVAFVRSIRTGFDSAWVSNLFVKPEYRRRGLGRAVMSAMLRDDALHGIRNSVLLASSAGSKLYPLLGYRQIGTLSFFLPVQG